MKKDTFILEDPKGFMLSWVNESESYKPEHYLTAEGRAYLNGYLQSNKTLRMIKVEEYNDLIDKYNDLIDEYEQLKIVYEKLPNFIKNIFK